MRYLGKFSSLSTAVIIATALLFSACSKKSEEGVILKSNNQLSPVRDHALLAYLPANTIAFSLLDYTLPSATQWLASPWGKNQFSFSDITKKLDEKEADAKKLLLVLEGLEDAGLLPSPGSSSTLTQVLAFASTEKILDTKERPTITILEIFKDGVDLKAKLASAQAEIEKAGATVKTKELANGQAFTTELVLFRGKDTSQEPITVPLTIMAQGSRLLLTTSTLANADYLSSVGAKNTGMDELRTSASYGDALKQVPETASEFSFSYFDIKGLAGKVFKLIPDNTLTVDDLNKFPLQSVAFVRSMNEALVDSGAIVISKDSTNQAFTQELSNLSDANFAEKVPAGLVGVLSIDGALVRALSKTALDSTPVDKRAETEELIAPLLKTKEIGLTVRPQKGASPLPELALLFETSDATSLGEAISNMITAGSSGSGFLPPFQNKDIDGVPVKYALSPFGAGVYVGVSGDNVFLSTAETLMTELIAIQKGSSADGLKTLSQENRELLRSAKALGVFHVNYSSVAQLVDSLSASLSIFTGGQPLMAAADLAALRGLGETAIQVLFDDGVIRFVSRSESPKQSSK